jgi:hypothetical protein
MLFYSAMKVLIETESEFGHSQVTDGMGSDGFTDVTVKIM